MKRHAILPGLPALPVLLTGAGLCLAPQLIAQTGLIDQPSHVVRVGEDKFFTFYGLSGRTYFLQISDPENPLRSWTFAPVIEAGNDEWISYEVDGTPPHGFFRLRYTDEPVPPGFTLEEWDADGDGMPNQWEIGNNFDPLDPTGGNGADGDPDGDGLTNLGEYLHGTHPLLASTNGSGIPDGWLVAHGLDPLADHSEEEFGDSGITNEEAYQAGVQAHPDATLEDFDGDGIPNEFDGHPRDRIIDWRRGPRPAFGVIELGMEDVEQIGLNDLFEDGTALFTRFAPPSSTSRIVVDRQQTVHPFFWSSPPADSNGFGAYSETLVDGKVIGHKNEGMSNRESIWDPVAGTYEDYSSPAFYHTDLRDDRNRVTLWWGDHGETGNFGLRRLPGGQLLPGAAAVDPNHNTWRARIEKNGNIVANGAYWRWDEDDGEFDQPVDLPVDAGGFHRSATIVQETDAGERKWNLVAGSSEGLLISRNGGAFRKPASPDFGPDAELRAVTKQGWVLGNQGIWANGGWHALAGLVGGDPAPSEVEMLDMLDTGLAIAKVRRGNDPLKLALLVPVEVVELAPRTRNGENQEIVGSEFPDFREGRTNPMVEINPALNRIAHREIKVRIGDGKILQGKQVTWSMLPLFIPPDGEDTEFRGDWEAAPQNHRDRFAASAAYGANGFTRLSQEQGRTTIGEDGITAIRVNLPPIGFNKARIRIEIEDTEDPVDLIDLEVPAVVVIDPGHGDNDPGAVGAGNVREKDLALDYGLRLREALVTRFEDEERWLRVVMTRTEDEFINLGERSTIARDNGADVFVSIHFNSGPASARGTETFVQRATNGNVNLGQDAALAALVQQSTVLAVQNQDAGGAHRQTFPENWVLNDAQQPIPGVKTANFMVTQDGAGHNGNVQGYHPVRACLIEVEFLSNATALESVKLTNPSGTAIRDAFGENVANDIFNDIQNQP